MSCNRYSIHGAETNREQVITEFQKFLFSERGKAQNLSCENEYNKKNRFHINAFALSRVLKQRLGATRRGPTARTLVNLLMNSYDRGYKRQHSRFKSVPFYLFVGRCNETLANLTHIFRELDIVPTKAEDQVRCVAQVDAVFNGLEKEWKSLQVKINSSSPLIAELSPAQWSTIDKKIWFSLCIQEFWFLQNRPYVRPHIHISGCEMAHLLAGSPRHTAHFSCLTCYWTCYGQLTTAKQKFSADHCHITVSGAQAYNSQK